MGQNAPAAGGSSLVGSASGARLSAATRRADIAARVATQKSKYQGKGDHVESTCAHENLQG